MFSVEDTGCGIAPEDQEHIFKHFEQVGAAGLRQGGTGLGLSICRSFAKLMGGDITVSSKPGAGSCFSFSVLVEPGESNEAVHVGPAARPLQIREGQGEQRVLVVDDRDTNRDILCRLLQHLGFVTRGALNGAEALTQFQEWSPQVVLIALVMPVMGGREAIQRMLGYRPSTFMCPLKALEVFREAPEEFDVVVTDELLPGLRGSELLFKLREVRPDIPVILYSGFSEAIRGVSQDKLPFNVFVTKPMVISELTRAIRDCAGSGGAVG